MDEFCKLLLSNQPEFEKIQQLIDKGYDINQKIQFESNEEIEFIPPIILCVLAGNIDAINFLVKNNVNLETVDNQNFSALFYAASLDLEVFEHLLKCGANFSGQEFSQKVVFDLLKEKQKLNLIYDKFPQITDWSNIDNKIYEEIKSGFEKLQLEQSINKEGSKSPKIKI